MANWDNLKASIEAVIKQNGQEKITGQVLQNTLKTIVNSVGKNATFAGIATPETNPGAPDGPVFYLAATAGTYVNFSNIDVATKALILSNEGDVWVSKETNILTADAVEQYINTINEKFRINTQNLKLLVDNLGVLLNVDTNYTAGYIDAGGDVGDDGGASKHSDFVEIKTGAKYYIKSHTVDLWNAAFYTQKNKESFLKSQEYVNSNSETAAFPLDVPSGAKYVRVTLNALANSEFLFTYDMTNVSYELLKIQNQIDNLKN